MTIVWKDSETETDLVKVTSKALMKLLTEGWEINEENSLVSLISAVQILPVGTSVELKAVRGDEKNVVEATTSIIESDDFWYERGLILSAGTLVHTADSLGDAMSLGFRQSKRKLGEVFSFLKMAVTGRVGLNMLGGPIAIASVASNAASDGTTSLLMFLTFLSVNLAVLNFLPIPALDGGHMVFLICEAARGRPVDEELQAKLTMAGVLALLSLMAFVIINDWLRLVG
jgi:regulator of sigma E protease